MASFRRVSPVFDHRFTIDAIRGAYPSLDEAFLAGDYDLVGEYAPDGSELQACGFALCMLPEKAAPIFAALGETLSPRGLVCHAFCLWQLDRGGEALALLARVPEGDAWKAAADRLAAVVPRTDIPIFVISTLLSPYSSSLPESALQPEIPCGQFTVRHVGTLLDRNAYPYEVTQPFDAFIDGLPEAERPLFIYGMTPQAILPLNYEKVAIPKIMWCHDTDLYFSRASENFRLHDLNVVATSQEHFELSRALGDGTPVVANMMTDVWFMPLKQRPRETAEKDIDLLFTGVSLLGLHSEKPRFMYRMARLADEFEIRIVDGHMPEEEYLDTVKRARFQPIVARYMGNNSPRWREALINSVMVLYPEGTLFGKITEGCLPFRAETLEDDFRRILTEARAGHYDVEHVVSQAETDLAFLRRPREKQMERQFRFCVMALILQGELRPAPARATAPRRRLAWLTPTLDKTLWSMGRIKPYMLKVAEGAFNQPDKDERDYVFATMLFSQLLHGLGSSGSAETAFHRTLRKRLLDEGLARYPRSLALRFNEAHWAFLYDVIMDPNKRPSPLSLLLFRRLIDDFDTLEFDDGCVDLGLPYTDADQVFPYYEYTQTVLRTWISRNDPAVPPPAGHVEPRRVLLSAAHGYVGWGHFLANRFERAGAGGGAVREALSWMDRALAIYPDNLRLKGARFQMLATTCQTDPRAIEPRVLVDAFHDYADLYPTALLLNLEQPVHALARLEAFEELRALLADWYRFAGTVTFHPPFIDKYRQVAAAVLAHLDHAPEKLRRKVAEWRASDVEPETLSQVDRFLWARINRRF